MTTQARFYNTLTLICSIITFGCALRHDELLSVTTDITTGVVHREIPVVDLDFDLLSWNVRRSRRPLSGRRCWIGLG